MPVRHMLVGAGLQLVAVEERVGDLDDVRVAAVVADQHRDVAPTLRHRCGKNITGNSCRPRHLW